MSLFYLVNLLHLHCKSVPKVAAARAEGYEQAAVPAAFGGATPARQTGNNDLLASNQKTTSLVRGTAKISRTR